MAATCGECGARARSKLARSHGERSGMSRRDHSSRRGAAPSSWDAVADWYNGWVGAHGSTHHRHLAIPAVLRLLRAQPGEHILDVGAGPGVLAPAIAATGARYTGVDASPRLVRVARTRHGHHGRFLVADARHLQREAALSAGGFDGVVFLLSLQDMDPLEEALHGAAWALGRGGRAVLLLTHPCFRIPRQSGWGWDEQRRLAYRRIDRYLTPLAVPMRPPTARGGSTRSFHRPLGAYINALAACGLLVDAVEEIPAANLPRGAHPPADNDDIPLFLGLRAVRR